MKPPVTEAFNLEDEVEKNVLGNALLHWEKYSRALKYHIEADEIHILSIVVFKSTNILATKSLRVNQLCRDVVCSISPNITAQLSPILVNGCCVEIYQRLLCILHSTKITDSDKSKLSSIISFLNSDKEFTKVLKAHQNIEDSHRLLNLFNPHLNLSHSSYSSEDTTNNYIGEDGGNIPMMKCGKCVFHCTMAPH